MPVQTQIQVRRSTAATWTSTNPTLASGEIGFETDANKFKIGNGSDTWNSLAYANDGDITAVTAGIGISGGGISGNVTITNAMATAIDAKGDLIIGTGADTFSRLAVGANNQILVADSATTTGTKWADNTAPFDIAITVPAGTQKDSVSATYTLPAGVYTVQCTGSSLNTVVYGANSFTSGTASNAIIQNLASPASTISLTLNRSWTGTVSFGNLNADANIVAFENGYFTVTGRNNSSLVQQCAWSTNGTSWNNLTLPNVQTTPTKVIRNMANNLWVMVSSTNIYTSPDGSTGASWTTRAATGNSQNNVFQGTSNSYVALAGQGTLRTSTDAITWTARTSGTTQNLVSITYFNSLYIIGSDEGYLATSTDGITWTARTSQFGNLPIRALNVVNNLVVATGDRLSSSTDGITWTSRTKFDTSSSKGIVWDGTLYGMGSTLSYRTSTDLATWTSRTVTNFGWAIAQNGQTVVMVPQNGSAGAYSLAGAAGATSTSSFTRFNLGTPVTAS